MRLFGLIRLLIQKEQRNVYYALDMSWLDRILLPESKVHVTYLSGPPSEHNFATLMMPQHPQQPLPSSPADEIYQILVAELPPGVEPGTANGGDFDYRGIDKFLALNPCWMPLHEPQNSTLNFNPSNSRQHHNHHHLSHQITRARSFFYAQQRIVVFVRLPIFGFHATCRLYSQIVLHQHPQQCIYTDERMMVHHLHNTGWSATYNAILFKLQHILIDKVYPQKIVVATQAIDFRSRVRTLTDQKTGTKFNTSFGWYWSNPENCPEEIEAYDPWNCNFISISNCTQKQQGISLLNPPYPPPSKDKSAETPAPIFQDNFDKQALPNSPNIREQRRIYYDGPSHSEEQWAYHRLHAFLQRPNYNLRNKIRKSFRNLEPLGLAAGGGGGGGGNGAGGGGGGGGNGQKQGSGNAHHPHSHPHHHLTLQTPLSNNMQRPCLAIHVRHGDSNQDTRGNPERKIDRSLASHVSHARNLTTSLGITNIFIASDNSSVINRSPTDFPEFQWFTQKRPIKDWGVMYDVHNEDDIQLELAHVIVDTRLAASCDAIIGSFDSGFAEQMIVAACQISREGRCPPTVDLREVYHDYGR